MELTELLQAIRDARIFGVAYLAVYEIPAHSKWELFVFEKLSIPEISAEEFIESLIEIGNSKLAISILTSLLYKDLAYNAEIIPLEQANLLANAFISTFSTQATYFSNSTWNKNEYRDEYREGNRNHELGLSSWTPFTEATFDSGVIIYDNNRIGIAWFADED
jgi:hypothetical protein